MFATSRTILNLDIAAIPITLFIGGNITNIPWCFDWPHNPTQTLIHHLNVLSLALTVSASDEVKDKLVSNGLHYMPFCLQEVRMCQLYEGEDLLCTFQASVDRLKFVPALCTPTDHVPSHQGSSEHPGFDSMLT